MANGFGGAQTDQTTMGQEPSFVFTDALISPNVLAPYTLGADTRGVPPNDAIAGSGVSGAQAAADYGSQKASQPAHQSPIFWSVVLLILGVFVLGHIARLEIRS